MFKTQKEIRQVFSNKIKAESNYKNLFLGICCLEDPGHNLLFLDQERSDDPAPDTTTAFGSTISPADTLNSL